MEQSVLNKTNCEGCKAPESYHFDDDGVRLCKKCYDALCEEVEKQYEAEYKLLYSILVAGKTAEFAAKVLDRFCAKKPSEKLLFEFIQDMDTTDGALLHCLKECRSGSYTRIERCFREVAELDVMTCTLSELEAIHGIGPKTARFFLKIARNDQDHAVLDTHTLKWLKYLGHDVPKSTPSGEKYLKIEKIFLDEAIKRGIDAAKLDTLIWEYCKNNGHKTGVWPGILDIIL